MPPALTAFLFHAPGLRLTGYRLNTETKLLNVAALLATLAAMTQFPPFQAWLVGHLAWSLILAALVHQGKAGGP